MSKVFEDTLPNIDDKKGHDKTLAIINHWGNKNLNPSKTIVQAYTIQPKLEWPKLKILTITNIG